MARGHICPVVGLLSRAQQEELPSSEGSEFLDTRGVREGSVHRPSLVHSSECRKGVGDIGF